MFNHAPPGYVCPFCRNLTTGASEYPLEILHRYDRVAVKLNIRWRPTNPGTALVVPVQHYENVYDLPPDLGADLQEAVRDTALAMKAAFRCDGISTRQHNEPAGDQDVWHHHVHVLPRYRGDDLGGGDHRLVPPEEMREVADRLRAAWPRKAA